MECFILCVIFRKFNLVVAAHKNILMSNTLDVIQNFWHGLNLLISQLFQGVNAPSNFTSRVVVITPIYGSVLTFGDKIVSFSIAAITIIKTYVGVGIILSLITEYISFFGLKIIIFHTIFEPGAFWAKLRLVNRKIEFLFNLIEILGDWGTGKLRLVFKLWFVHPYFTWL